MMARPSSLGRSKEIDMGKYDDMFKEPPKEPFEPTPWLIVILIVVSIALVSVIDSCEVAS